MAVATIAGEHAPKRVCLEWTEISRATEIGCLIAESLSGWKRSAAVIYDQFYKKKKKKEKGEEREEAVVPGVSNSWDFDVVK